MPPRRPLADRCYLPEVPAGATQRAGLSLVARWGRRGYSTATPADCLVGITTMGVSRHDSNVVPAGHVPTENAAQRSMNRWHGVGIPEAGH